MMDKPVEVSNVDRGDAHFQKDCNMNQPRYAVITPVRNEAEHIHHTINSMRRQTILPDRWVIVDDGSTDQTGRIIDEAAARDPWIVAVHRKDRGYRQAGGGVIEAFYDGYQMIDGADWDYLVKLDGDLGFDPDYFEQCFQEFERDASLGIGGGTIQNLVEGQFVANEKAPLFHVRGATKIYRRGCWGAIGGLIKAPGWDTLDEVKANMCGWNTRSFPHIFVKHYRPTGLADGTWKSWVKNGMANYVSGYHPLFMTLKCMKRMLERPYLIAATGLLCGFASGYVKQVPQVEDPELICYLRKQQLRRLLGKKSIWK